MDLEPFGWSIGITDILNWRECPQRFVWGMRRHATLPERLQLTPGEKDEPPESTNWSNAYGSAIHHALALVAQGQTHEKAIADCMSEYGTYLEPGDYALLSEDLAKYEHRKPNDVTLVTSEAEMRVPLFVHEGQQIYYRFRLDVLYKLNANPTVFVHRDYKSSRWRKTPAEVHNDPQMWSYNWAIHELWPECTHLLQEYDQLKFGVIPTTKNAQQRVEMKAWLISQVKAIMADEVYKPKLNDFCRYCDLVMTCREPRRATTWARARIATLATVKQVGRKTMVEFQEDIDSMDELMSDLPKMMAVRKLLERIEKEAKTLIEEMGDEQRLDYGWKLTDRRVRQITADGMRELHDIMGDEFYALINLPITRLEEMFGKPKRGEPVPVELQVARNNTVESVSGTNLARTDTPEAA